MNKMNREDAAQKGAHWPLQPEVMCARALALSQSRGRGLEVDAEKWTANCYSTGSYHAPSWGVTRRPSVNALQRMI